MSRTLKVLCVMLSLSLVLGSISHVHAHFGGEQHEPVRVHAGHDHQLVHAHVPDHDRHTGEHHDVKVSSDGSQVLDLGVDVMKAPSAAKFMQWIAVLSVVVILFGSLSPSRIARPPPRIRTRPPSPYPHAQPLLRGPPVSI